MITLGPILGIEDDYQYSLILLLPDSVETGSLKLITVQNTYTTKHDFLRKEKTLTYHFYRFSFSIPKSQSACQVSYSLELNGRTLRTTENESSWEFVVPGEHDVPKVGFASCNGNDKTLPDSMSKNDFVMWKKLIEAHNQKELDYSFHCLLLNGDQVYADPIWEHITYFSEQNLLGWNSSEKMVTHKVSRQSLPALTRQIEAFYENLYLSCWSQPQVAKALASIPSIMMWDDHDIFDGWGSYPMSLQNCEVFQIIFSIAKKYFELLQVRTIENASLISQSQYSQKVNFRNYEIIVLDNRSHRTRNNIMSEEQYLKLESIKDEPLFEDCPEPLRNQKMLLFVVPVPIAHLNYKKQAEGWLSWLCKSNFRKSLDDDALDHWDHHLHEAEQKKLIDLIFAFGDAHSPKYVCIVSGDVHSAGSGRIDRTEGKLRHVNQLISSPIVYKPIGKFGQWIMHWASEEITTISGYTVQVDKFGIGGTAPANIYERNFGFLYKAAGRGIKFYLTLEHDQKKYRWDQPWQFNPEN